MTTTEMVSKHDWQQGIDYLYLDDCQYPHEIFERVFVNLGAKNGCRWINIFNADMSSVFFPDKIIGFLIVEKYLKKVLSHQEILLKTQN
jgi:hypothetical protein